MSQNFQSIWANIDISLIFFKCLGAILIVVAGFILSKIARKIIKKIIRPAKAKNDAILTEKRAETLQSVAVSTVKYAIYFLVAYCLIEIFTSGKNNPLLAVAGAAGVAFGLGAQNLIKDVISGFFIIFEDQYAIGDTVDILGNSGVIEEIGLRSTKLRGFSGQLITIPNGIIDTVTNWSKDYAKAMVDVKVSHDEDIDKVITLLNEESAKAHAELDSITEPPVVMGITSWGDLNLSLRISLKCKSGENWAVERDLRLRIKRRFEKEGIKPPYPERGNISIN